MIKENWTQIEITFALLIFYQLKQFVADFPLQGEYMLKKTRMGWNFVPPLLFHCSVHATLTALLVLWVCPHLWWLIGIDFVVHFVMDRIKSGPKYLGRFHNKEKPAFWNCLGFDQMVHHLTHLYIVWIIIHQGWN